MPASRCPASARTDAGALRTPRYRPRGVLALERGSGRGRLDRAGAWGWLATHAGGAGVPPAIARGVHVGGGGSGLGAVSRAAGGVRSEVGADAAHARAGLRRPDGRRTMRLHSHGTGGGCGITRGRIGLWCTAAARAGNGCASATATTGGRTSSGCRLTTWTRYAPRAWPVTGRERSLGGRTLGGRSDERLPLTEPVHFPAERFAVGVRLRPSTPAKRGGRRRLAPVEPQPGGECR